MNRLIVLLALVTIPLISSAQPVAHRMKLLSNWNNPNLNKVDSVNIWNDIAAWHDSSTGREYVIAGSTDSIYFFDITDPYHIKLCDVEDGNAKGVINRDYEVYLHYVYCVADQNKGSLQVFDLKYLPDSVHKVYDDDSLCINAHTLFVEAASRRLYLCSPKYRNNQGSRQLDILSLDSPEHPVFLAHLAVPKQSNGDDAFKWVHEAHVRNDTAYLACGYHGMYIYDLRDVSKQTIISSLISYPKAGYCHGSWLNASGKYIILTDEIPEGLDVKIFDISVLQAPRIKSMFNSNVGATPHNAYWYGDFAYVSHYHDGVTVFNIKNIDTPYLEAYYDTYPQNPAGNYTGKYSGCWGVWPYLPSGNIVASDRSNGIFVLKPDSGLLGITENRYRQPVVSLFPNPASAFLHISVDMNEEDDVALIVYNLQGKQLHSFDNAFKTNRRYTIAIDTLAPGIYMLEACGKKGISRVKFVKD